MQSMHEYEDTVALKITLIHKLLAFVLQFLYNFIDFGFS